MKKMLLKKENKIIGMHTGIAGDYSDIIGNISNISGNVSDIKGNVTGIKGNLDECEITDEERKQGINIINLIKETE